MPRTARVAPGGEIYHVLNRAAGWFRMMKSEKDFAAMRRIIAEAHERVPIRILAYCLMGNHWHFVVWPREEGELSAFFRWMTHTHAVRWRVAHGTEAEKAVPSDGPIERPGDWVRREGGRVGMVGRGRGRRR